MNREQAAIEKNLKDLANALGPKIVGMCNSFRNETLESKRATEQETNTIVVHALTGALMGIVIDVLPPGRREIWLKHLQVSFREKFEEIDAEIP